MRLFLSILLSFSLAAAYLVEDPQRFTNFTKYVAKTWSTYFEERSLIVTGNTILPRSEVVALLPSDRGNLWWRFNLSAVELNLRDSPFILNAEVTPCSMVSLTCYRVDIVERKAAFIAVVRDESKAWVIGEDGGFIAPLTNKQFREGDLGVLGEEASKLVVVKGLWGESSSPDAVRAKLLRVGTAIQELSVVAPVKLISILPNLEIQVRFRDLPFPVQFDLGGAKLKAGEVDMDAYQREIKDKAERLKRILIELSGSFDKVAEVDLAFERVGVVKLRS